MTSRSSRSGGPRSIDLDEIAPNTFLIHNDQVRPVLRGEGVTVGHTFELVSGRRAGLLGRLRMRGFNVRTLYSRLKALPGLSDVEPLGQRGYRDASAKEQWSYFELNTLHWQAIQTFTKDDQLLIQARHHQILRRRRSRSGGEHFQAILTDRGLLNMLPLEPAKALMKAYAQATASSDIEVETIVHDDGFELPLSYVLPPAYLEMLERAGTKTATGVRFSHVAWPLAVGALHKLRLHPEHGDQAVVNLDIDPNYGEDLGDDDDD